MIYRKGTKISLGKQKSEVHFGVSLGGCEALSGLTWMIALLGSPDSEIKLFFSFTSFICTYYSHKLAFSHILYIVEGYILKFTLF